MEYNTLEQFILARVDTLEKQLDIQHQMYDELLEKYNKKCEAADKIVAILAQSNKLSPHSLQLIKECLK